MFSSQASKTREYSESVIFLDYRQNPKFLEKNNGSRPNSRHNHSDSNSPWFSVTFGYNFRHFAKPSWHFWNHKFSCQICGEKVVQNPDFQWKTTHPERILERNHRICVRRNFSHCLVYLSAINSKVIVILKILHRGRQSGWERIGQGFPARRNGRDKEKRYSSTEFRKRIIVLVYNLHMYYLRFSKKKNEKSKLFSSISYVSAFHEISI